MFQYYFLLGLRSLRRNPALTALMVLTLAIGVPCFPAGSSATRRWGVPARARAIPTRGWGPPDSSAG